MRPRLHLPLAAVASAAALVLAACGSSDDTSSSTSTAASGQASTSACSPGRLQTYAKGKLTVATDKPAYPPYFVDDKPTNGKGFESAVAYAIAGQLGFTRAQVDWTVEPFNSSYAPGPKKFDFDVNQISITDKRRKFVDFSHTYFTAPQAVVVPKGGKLAPRSLADLKGAQIGVQVGTTSLDAVQQTIKPSKQPKVFSDSNDVVTALKQGGVSAVIVDLPTAFYLTSAEVQGARIAGQFQAPGGDAWGALLKKGSPLTPCVDQAVDKLTASGALKRIQARWLGAGAGAPALR